MRPLVLLVGLLVAACSSTGLFYDPVFGASGEARAATGDCPSGNTCVEVPLEGLADAAGETGRCEIFTTPGDPETMEPLVVEDVTVPDAGLEDELFIPFVWEVTIPGQFDPSGLNPVCGPMIEG